MYLFRRYLIVTVNASEMSESIGIVICVIASNQQR